MRHERLEEPAEDHGVGHVGALELVEAEHVALVGDLGRHEGHAVDVAAVLELHLVEALVDVLHEVVEVDARLGPHVLRERVVKEVHEHRLAAAHVAEQVEPPREVAGNLLDGRLAAPEPREEGLVGLEGVEGRVDDRGRVVVPQLLVQVLEALDYPW